MSTPAVKKISVKDTMVESSCYAIIRAGPSLSQHGPPARCKFRSISRDNSRRKLSASFSHQFFLSYLSLFLSLFLSFCLYSTQYHHRLYLHVYPSLFLYISIPSQFVKVVN